MGKMFILFTIVGVLLTGTARAYRRGPTKQQQSGPAVKHIVDGAIKAGFRPSTVAAYLGALVGSTRFQGGKVVFLKRPEGGAYLKLNGGPLFPSDSFTVRLKAQTLQVVNRHGNFLTEESLIRVGRQGKKMEQTRIDQQ